MLTFKTLILAVMLTLLTGIAMAKPLATTAPKSVNLVCPSKDNADECAKCAAPECPSCHNERTEKTVAATVDAELHCPAVDPH